MKKKLKKIVMIGPVYPYKGGISHYTGMMYRELSKNYDVFMVSFKMQYPHILYGKEQKDYTNDSFAVKNAEYIIHTANPFNIVKAAKRIGKMQPDMVIIQWWHPYFAPCYRILEYYLKHTVLVFVCHNVFPHEKFPMDKKLTAMILKHGDAFLVQSKTDQKDLLMLKPDAVHRRIYLPTFHAFKMQNLSKNQARKLLNIGDEERVLLFFGFVRKYKGLRHLICAMPHITVCVERIKLLIVGDFDSDRMQYMELIEKNNLSGCVEIVEGYVPDREVEKYFAACDLVVLPYESATQSGIVQIAYGFERPVVATNVGGLPDVVSDGKTGYLVAPKQSKELAHAVVRYFDEKRETEFQENIKMEAYKYSWEWVTEAVEEMWSDLSK